MDVITSVWTLPALIVAVLGGFAVGAFVLAVPIGSPRYSSRGAGPLAYALLVFGLSALCDCVFYGGQVAEAMVSGDPLWPRVVSRALIRLVFDALIGVGVFFALRRAQR